MPTNFTIVKLCIFAFLKTVKIMKLNFILSKNVLYQINQSNSKWVYKLDVLILYSSINQLSFSLFCIFQSDTVLYFPTFCGERLFSQSYNLSFSESCFLAHVSSLSQFRFSTLQSSLLQTLTKWTPTTLSGTKYGCNQHLTPDLNHVAHGSTPGPPCLCLRYCLRMESWWPTRGKSFVCDRLDKDNQDQTVWLS